METKTNQDDLVENPNTQTEETIPCIHLFEEPLSVSSGEEMHSSSEFESGKCKLKYARLIIRLKNNIVQIAGGILVLVILGAIITGVLFFLICIGAPSGFIGLVGLLGMFIVHKPILDTVNILLFRTPIQICLALRSCFALKDPNKTVSLYVRACLGFGEYGTEQLQWLDWPLAYVCLSSGARKSFETKENFLSFWSDIVEQIKRMAGNIMGCEEKSSICFHWLSDNEAVDLRTPEDHNENRRLFSCNVGIKNNFDVNIYQCKINIHGSIVREGEHWYIDSAQYSIAKAENLLIKAIA